MTTHLIINLGILLLFSALGYWEAKRLASNNKDVKLETLHHKARYIYLIIAAIIVAFAFIGIPMMNRTLMWKAPLWFDLFGIDLSFSLVIGCFSFLFSLSSAISVMTRHKERKGIILASILIVSMFPVFQYQYTNPLYPKLHEIKVKGIILQSNPSSCAAASGANIAHILGIEKTEKEIAQLMSTTEIVGTNVGQIINAMEQVGIKCSKNWVEDSNAEKISPPAMFFIDNEEIGPESHAVAFVGFEGKHLEIWDPLEGKVLFTPDKFQEIWHGKSVECSIAKGGG